MEYPNPNPRNTNPQIQTLEIQTPKYKTKIQTPKYKSPNTNSTNTNPLSVFLASSLDRSKIVLENAAYFLCECNNWCSLTYFLMFCIFRPTYMVSQRNWNLEMACAWERSLGDTSIPTVGGRRRSRRTSIDTVEPAVIRLRSSGPDQR